MKKPHLVGEGGKGPDLFVGHWVYEAAPGGEFPRQGYIKARRKDGRYKVYWFSWDDGEVCKTEVVPAARIATWDIYADEQAWLKVGEELLKKRLGPLAWKGYIPGGRHATR